MMKKISEKINRILRYFINRNMRRKLTNKNITLVSSDCNGTFILHDLGLRFNSPFVNLWMLPTDFIKMLSNFEYYNKQTLEFIKVKEVEYPIGKLDDIAIHFMHYKDEREVKMKWERRKKRQDMNNLFVMMTDRNGCTEQDLIDFDNLPFKNKVVFTHKYYPNLKSAYYIKGFENQKELGYIFEFSGISGKKYYDQFDYIRFFNEK